MADWKKCVNEDCQYFRENGKCHEVCKDSKIKRILTNADRIRSMDNEELAEFLSSLIRNGHEYLTGEGDWLQWLQSEAE